MVRFRLRSAAPLLLLAALLLVPAVAHAEGPDAQEETLLLQEPTISAKHIVFVYAGDLWVVGRKGGRRPTA